MTWQADAACRGVDPSVFVLDRGEKGDAARSICARCPVRTECLDHALDRPELQGIWGGLDNRQRRIERSWRRRRGVA